MRRRWTELAVLYFANVKISNATLTEREKSWLNLVCTVCKEKQDTPVQQQRELVKDHYMCDSCQVRIRASESPENFPLDSLTDDVDDWPEDWELASSRGVAVEQTGRCRC